MTYKIIELNCPGCGANVTTDQKFCSYCDREIVVTSFNDISSLSAPEINKYANTYKKALTTDPDHKGINNAMAMCYLKLKLYDKAQSAFEKAMEDNFENSETFFYAAVCLLQGKKAFVTPRAVIDKIEEYIDAALMIEEKAIYYYFKAYIRYDHHKRKFYNVSPNFSELFNQAKNAGLSASDVKALYSLLGVEQPSCL